MTLQTPAAGTGARWLTAALAVLGALVAAWAIVGGALAAVPSQASDATLTSDVDGVTAIDLSTSAGELQIDFDDVDQARLEVSSSRGDADGWRLDVEDGTLVVDSPDPWGWPPLGGRGESFATLTLPESLEGIDGVLDLGAGSMHVAGEWGDLELSISAGSVTFEGSTEALAIDMSAGELDVTAAVDGDVRIDVSAGSVGAELSGDMPALALDVAAGDVDLGVPPGPYAVTVDAVAGSPHIDVTERQDADRTIDVDLSAGSVDIVESS